MPKVMVLGGVTFRMYLGHEDRDLMNEINAFIKETPENSLHRFTMWRYDEKFATQRRMLTSPGGFLTSDFQPP